MFPNLGFAFMGRFPEVLGWQLRFHVLLSVNILEEYACRLKTPRRFVSLRGVQVD